MGLTVNLDSAGIQRIVEHMSAGMDRALPFFQWLAIQVHQDTQLTFRLEGARAGHEPWIGWSRGRGHILGGTTRTKAGTWKIRYGTNLMGRAKGSYKPFELRPGVRRYSPLSKLLQSSGEFQKSFGVRELDNKHMVYGTDHRLKGKIGSDPERQVLFVTDQDKELYKKRFINYYRLSLQMQG